MRNSAQLRATRVALQDYRQIEATLGALYAEPNFYCYSVDSKAPTLFFERIKSLTKCFPNVRISPVRPDLESDGHMTVSACDACLPVKLTTK